MIAALVSALCCEVGYHLVFMIYYLLRLLSQPHSVAI